MNWPKSSKALIEAQREIAGRRTEPWDVTVDNIVIGGCFVAFGRGIEGPGAAGDPAWAAAVLMRDGETVAEAMVQGVAGAPYEAGLLALREGVLLESAMRALPRLPDVLMVNGTGRDHPRHCGLALHLGVVLGVPTVGVTHRPLLASGGEPGDDAGAAAPLVLEGETVGYRVRVRRGVRALVVHAGWRTTSDDALAVVRRSLGRGRTPEALRRARELARLARHRATETS